MIGKLISSFLDLKKKKSYLFYFGKEILFSFRVEPKAVPPWVSLSCALPLPLRRWGEVAGGGRKKRTNPRETMNALDYPALKM